MTQSANTGLAHPSPNTVSTIRRRSLTVGNHCCRWVSLWGNWYRHL